jgi:hypothetical protein
MDFSQQTILVELEMILQTVKDINVSLVNLNELLQNTKSDDDSYKHLVRKNILAIQQILHQLNHQIGDDA